MLWLSRCACLLADVTQPCPGCNLATITHYTIGPGCSCNKVRALTSCYRLLYSPSGRSATLPTSALRPLLLLWQLPAPAPHLPLLTTPQLSLVLFPLCTHATCYALHVESLLASPAPSADCSSAHQPAARLRDHSAASECPNWCSLPVFNISSMFHAFCPISMLLRHVQSSPPGYTCSANL